MSVEKAAGGNGDYGALKGGWGMVTDGQMPGNALLVVAEMGEAVCHPIFREIPGTRHKSSDCDSMPRRAQSAKRSIILCCYGGT